MFYPPVGSLTWIGALNVERMMELVRKSSKWSTLANDQFTAHFKLTKKKEGGGKFFYYFWKKKMQPPPPKSWNVHINKFFLPVTRTAYRTLRSFQKKKIAGDHFLFTLNFFFPLSNAKDVVLSNI